MSIYTIDEYFVKNSDLSNIVSNAEDTLKNSHKWRQIIKKIDPKASRFAPYFCLVSSIKRLMTCTNKEVATFAKKLMAAKVTTGAYSSAFPAECAFSSYCYYIAKNGTVSWDDIFCRDYWGQLDLEQPLQAKHKELNKAHWKQIWNACKISDDRKKDLEKNFDSWYDSTKGKDRYLLGKSDSTYTAASLENILTARIALLKLNPMEVMVEEGFEFDNIWVERKIANPEMKEMKGAIMPIDFSTTHYNTVSRSYVASQLVNALQKHMGSETLPEIILQMEKFTGTNFDPEMKMAVDAIKQSDPTYQMDPRNGKRAGTISRKDFVDAMAKKAQDEAEAARAAAVDIDEEEEEEQEEGEEREL